jgi:hypothetical protein
MTPIAIGNEWTPRELMHVTTKIGLHSAHHVWELHDKHTSRGTVLPLARSAHGKMCKAGIGTNRPAHTQGLGRRSVMERLEGGQPVGPLCLRHPLLKLPQAGGQ